MTTAAWSGSSAAPTCSAYSHGPTRRSATNIIENVIIGIVLTDPARFTVTVKDGVVTVVGKPENASVGRAMIEEIRHVEGVVAVRDRLSYPPEPRSVPHTDMDLVL